MLNAIDQTTGWNIYIYIIERSLATSQPDKKYKYSIKYPADWTWHEAGATTFFLPPGESYIKEKTPKSMSISVRHRSTPINPVYIQYRTIRTVALDNERIKVLQANNLASDFQLLD